MDSCFPVRISGVPFSTGIFPVETGRREGTSRDSASARNSRAINRIGDDRRTDGRTDEETERKRVDGGKKSGREGSAREAREEREGSGKGTGRRRGARKGSVDPREWKSGEIKASF